MKTLLFASLVVIAVTALVSADTVNFDNLKTGAAPPGWTATQTGGGTPKWSVEKDDSAPSRPNVLRQSGEATFPVCIKTETNLKDGFAEVKFKPVAGKEDQAGGVIWRVRDANNYYIARANALEDNVTIYHTIDGSRVAFKNVNTKVTSGAWHTLRVDFEGNKFTVSFDGKKVIEANDESFKDAGKVGVWTKADSVTLFDNFTYGAR
jgi:predicted peroxiredoxin